MKILIRFLQRLFISLQMYFQNGIANHAAACAYAFLLSMAPALLMITFFILLFFRSSPGTITAFISTIPILGSIFDEQWLSTDIFDVSMPFIPALIFVVSVIFAGGILARAMQRGLKIIFPAVNKRSLLEKGLITLTIEAALLVFIIVVIFFSRTAMRIYRMMNFLPQASIIRYIATNTGGQIIYITLLAFGAFLIYLFVPAKPPKKFSAFIGSVFCGSCYFCTAFALRFILDKGRYHFLYGTFGNIIIVLINAYVFFTFFFVGAQYAYVRDSFKELPPSLFDVLKKDSVIYKAIQKYRVQVNKLRKRKRGSEYG